MTADLLFAWHPLTPRVWLVEGNGANSVVVASGRDVLLVDTKETGFGGALRREAERVVGRSVTRVVTTPHHTDHVMGNLAFTAEVPVIAQRRARERTVARASRALVAMATAVEWMQRTDELLDLCRRVERSDRPAIPAERAELLGTNLGVMFDELEQMRDRSRDFSCQPE